jgi:hypothetical protein
LFNSSLSGLIPKSFGKLAELKSMDFVGAARIDGGGDSE